MRVESFPGVLADKDNNLVWLEQKDEQFVPVQIHFFVKLRVTKAVKKTLL
jgi:hypothetical protein